MGQSGSIVVPVLPTSPEAKSCGATDFQCSSGECVKASVHCDGHPDCIDQSDEEGCSHTVACPTKLRCERSRECLLPEWLCDGQQDCRDRSDEKVLLLLQ